MGTVRDLGLLMLRMGVGASCFSHGAQKLFGWFLAWPPPVGAALTGKVSTRGAMVEERDDSEE